MSARPKVYSRCCTCGVMGEFTWAIGDGDRHKPAPSGWLYIEMRYPPDGIPALNLRVCPKCVGAGWEPPRVGDEAGAEVPCVCGHGPQVHNYRCRQCCCNKYVRRGGTPG